MNVVFYIYVKWHIVVVPFKIFSYDLAAWKHFIIQQEYNKLPRALQNGSHQMIVVIK